MMMSQLLDRAKKGDLNYIKTVPDDVLSTFRSETDDTLLSEAACEDQLECCKELYRRCPEVLYLSNVNRNTILHHVSGWRGGLLRMFEYFIDIGLKAEDNDIENGKHIRFKDWCRVQSRGGGTALLMAIKVRNLEIVRLWSKLDHDYELQLLRLADNNKYTALHLAVENQDIEIVKLLSTKEPSFDYAVNKIGETPLLTAMRKAQPTGNSTVDDISVNIRKLLLQTQPNQSKVQVGDKKWTSLHHATYNGDFGAVTDILQFCSDYELQLLSITDNDNRTALHLAVEYQNLEIVKLLSTKEPSFDYVVNKNGETPLLIAMRKAQPAGNSTVDDISVNIRKLLLQTQPNQSKVQVGDKKWTSLHQATYNGDFGAFTDILQFCPDCMELVDNEGLNFLHLAAKYQKVNVLTHVLEMKDIDANFLNLKDNFGRTALHIAAETGNQTMVEWLLYDPRVDKMTKNAKGQKVLDAITFEYDKEKAQIYGVRDRMDEKELKDQSDFDLVVGALIATVSFTAGITVPGGYISDGPNRGLAVLSKSTSFEAFVISNNFALVFSLYAVFSHFCTRRLLKREDIIYQLNVATFCTLGAIFAMMVAFITGSYAVLSISNRIAITVTVNSCCFFIFALRALLRMVMQYKHSGLWNVSGRNFLRYL